jgi:co-chaperonin GroES (HSP10)
MKAIGEYIVVEAVKEDSGIIVVPDSEKNVKHIVRSIGADVEIPIKPGDEILARGWINFDGADGKKYKICGNEDVLAVKE